MDQQRKQLKRAIFDLQKITVNRCFEPTEMCSKPAIRAHSIQNSGILGQLSDNGHVIMPKLHSNGGKPELVFTIVGRNKATTFTGLCGDHDARIFEPIDKTPIDSRNEEHLFLLAYRSVLREVHAVATGAVKNQLGYQEKVALGLIPGDVPTSDGMRAVAFIANAYESYLYKRKFDTAYTAGEYSNVQHVRLFEDGYLPTIAVSALFSLDDIPVEDDVARIALNVFPSGRGVSVVFSFLANEAPHVLPFLQPFISASGETLLQLLSVRILLSCENFVLCPRFWKDVGPSRRQAIAGLFSASLSKEVPVSDLSPVLLFSKRLG